MTRRQAPKRPPTKRSSRTLERGNIVLVAALIVLAMGATGVAVSRLVTSRLNLDADLRLSNFAGNLAQYHAESGVNALLYYWNTRQVALGSRPAAYPTIAPVIATYSVASGPAITVMTTGTYSLTITPAGVNTYSVVADATASNPYASQGWQNVTRRVIVTIASDSTPNAPYKITGYRR